MGLNDNSMTACWTTTWTIVRAGAHLIVHFSAVSIVPCDTSVRFDHARQLNDGLDDRSRGRTSNRAFLSSVSIVLCDTSVQFDRADIPY
jgi:hypothetical protein